MRIAFVLPGPVRVPQGGALVVAQHAERLAERGHDVTVLTPRSLGGSGGLARDAAVRLWNRSQGIVGPAFKVDRVDVVVPARLGPLIYDAVIATGHQTANPVARQAKGRGFYFIQGDERTIGRGVPQTWHLPLGRIAVSRWVADLVEAHGAPVLGVVPNAVDHEVWGVDRDPGQREDRIVALYHRHPVKGPETLIRALEELKRLRPAVEADVFSARSPSHRLPAWVGTHVRPSRSQLRRLYNRAAVCLHTSRAEGWGLVPMEAAACGCALVATASLGPREFLTPGTSMTEVPVGDGLALARQTARLLRNPALRTRQAHAAIESVQRFSWEDSTDRLEALLVEGVG